MTTLLKSTYLLTYVQVVQSPCVCVLFEIHIFEREKAELTTHLCRVQFKRTIVS